MKYENILIIGNGKGNIPEIFDAPIITFNKFKLGVDNEFHLTNVKQSGLIDKVQFDGNEPNNNFSSTFYETEERLTIRLGCKPSIGLTTLVIATIFFKKVHTCRMQLLPSYIRSKALSLRQPLASNFHNWLGERRVALQLLSSLVSWNGFALEKPQTGYSFSRDPFDLLQSIQDGAGQTIHRLKDVEADAWLHYATDAKIRSIEPFFFLQRSRIETPNWWLYDQELSHCVDDIVRKIAWSQQQLFSLTN